MGVFLVVLSLLAAYFLGAIPFSLLVGKLMAGVDIRTMGSGNVGATNVLRSLGTKGAILALSGDVFKGVLPTWLGMMIGGPGLAAACALIAVLGHCFSVFLSFKGGKGVATSAGIVLYLMPKVVLILLIAFIIIVVLSRYVSLGSIIVAALLPIMAFLFAYNNAYIIMSFFMAVLVIYLHKENIEKLKKGTESKIGQRV